MRRRIHELIEQNNDLMEEKGELIEELNRMRVGFQHFYQIYQRVVQFLF